MMAALTCPAALTGVQRCGVENGAAVFRSLKDQAIHEPITGGVAEVLVLMDDDFVQRVASGSWSGALVFVRNILDDVDKIYRRDMKIGLYFAAVRHYESKRTSMHEHLDDVSKVYEDMVTNKSRSDRIHGSADVTVAFTGKRHPVSDPYGVAGSALPNSACTTWAAALIQSYDLSTDNDSLPEPSYFVHNVAHEIGHAFGLPHLTDVYGNFSAKTNDVYCSYCMPPFHCLMYGRTLEAKFRKLQFTSCSQDHMKYLLRTDRLQCLTRTNLLGERPPFNTPLYTAILVLRSVLACVAGAMLLATIAMITHFALTSPIFQKKGEQRKNQ